MASIAHETRAAGATLPGAGEPAAAAYRELAPFYDQLTREHDYERWTDSLEPLLVRHGLAGRRLLDVACGTGKSFAPFVRRGYDVVACDLSPEMAALARERGAGRVDVRVADMRALPALGAFDAAICLGDSVNYLTAGPGDLIAAFAAATAALRPGGLYLFDLNTLHTYRSWFLTDHCIDGGELFFAWRGARAEPVAPGTLAVAVVEAFAPAPGGLWRRSASRHAQRHHPVALVRRLLGAAGFDAVWAYGQDATGAMRGAPDEQALTKTVFVARRERAPRDQGRR